MKYTIGYVDGHDLKYKTFNCEAVNMRDALDKFSEATKKHGDFEDRITSVTAADDDGESVPVKEEAGAFEEEGRRIFTEQVKKKLLDLLQEISYAFDSYSEYPEGDGEFWRAWSAMQKYISDNGRE